MVDGCGNFTHHVRHDNHGCEVPITPTAADGRCIVINPALLSCDTSDKGIWNAMSDGCPSTHKLAFTYLVVNANSLVKRNFAGKKNIGFCRNGFNAVGGSDTLVKLGRRCSLRVKLLPKGNRKRILAAGDGLAVDLPEGGVLLDQREAAVAEGPDVHQPLDEGEEQCRRGLQVDILANSAIPDSVGE